MGAWSAVAIQAAVLAAALWMAARPADVLGLLYSAMAPTSGAPQTPRPSAEVFPPGVLLGDADRWAHFTARCSGRALLTPACRAECAALGNATVRAPKPADSVMHVFSCHHCPAAASEDSLFDAIDRLQGDRPWGRTLDAGTGAGSLAWLLSKPPHAFAAPLVAVTASPVMRSDLVRQFPMADAADAPAPPVAATDVAPPAAPLDASAWALGAGVRLVMGEWASGALLPNETFDTVVADYLVGAVDGFAPHLQDIVLENVAHRVRRDGGQLYVTGMEPYPDRAPSPGGQLVVEMARLRDACILLSRDRPYREYPRDWVERVLRRAGMTIASARSMPTVYGVPKLLGQLAVCRHMLDLQWDALPEALRNGLDARLDELGDAIRASDEVQGGLCFGQDWLVHAHW